MILVTGGTGLVGSHLLYSLLKSEVRVRAIYREDSKLKGVKKLVDFYSPNQDLFSKIEWVKADVLDISALSDAMKDVNCVYHCAAKVSFNPKHKDELLETNIVGTENVVNVAIDNKVKKLCYVSSTSALGTLTNGEKITEKVSWQNNVTPSVYSVSKYHAECEVWRGAEEGLEVVIVNPAIIVGPGDWDSGSSAIFNRVWNGLNYYTEGGNGFVDVRDVVGCMITLMNKGIKNEQFLLVGENLSFKLFFELIAKGLNKNKPKIKATHFLTQLVWRMEKLRTTLSAKEPVITKESAKISVNTECYSNQKIKDILGIEFIPISKSIEDTCKVFKTDYHRTTL